VSRPISLLGARRTLDSVLRIHDTEIDAVLFDAGGIFVIPDPTVLAPLLAYFGATQDLDVYHRAHYRGMAAKSAAGSTESDWSVYNLAYVETVGVPTHEIEYAADILGRTRHAWLWRWPLQDSVEALRLLHARNVPIGVISNATGQIADLLGRSGVCQVGDGDGVPVRVIVDSHIVGVAKPDPRIFDFGLEALGDIDRARVAYVGDSVTMDIGGARAAGLFPVLLDPHDDHVGADFHRVRSLMDLLR
jgi:putative hydrolase of the HAD superfamily